MMMLGLVVMPKEDGRRRNSCGGVVCTQENRVPLVGVLAVACSISLQATRTIQNSAVDVVVSGPYMAQDSVDMARNVSDSHEEQ